MDESPYKNEEPPEDDQTQEKREEKEEEPEEEPMPEPEPQHELPPLISTYDDDDLLVCFYLQSVSMLYFLLQIHLTTQLPIYAILCTGST